MLQLPLFRIACIHDLAAARRVRGRRLVLNKRRLAEERAWRDAIRDVEDRLHGRLRLVDLDADEAELVLTAALDVLVAHRLVVPSRRCAS